MWADKCQRVGQPYTNMGMDSGYSAGWTIHGLAILTAGLSTAASGYIALPTLCSLVLPSQHVDTSPDTDGYNRITLWLDQPTRIKLSVTRYSILVCMQLCLEQDLALSIWSITHLYSSTAYTALPIWTLRYVTVIGSSLGWPSWSFPHRNPIVPSVKINPFIGLPMREQSSIRSFCSILLNSTTVLTLSHNWRKIPWSNTENAYNGTNHE